MRFKDNSFNSVSVLDKLFQYKIDLLCRLDTDGYFLALNTTCEKTIGYKSKELEGRQFLDFIHSEDVAIAQKAICELIQNRVENEFISRFINKDGSCRKINWHSFLDGNKFCILGEDITEQLRDEETIELFKASINNAVDEIYWTKKDGSFECVNEKAYRKLGYSKEEFSKLTLFDIDPSLSRERFNEVWNDCNIENGMECVSGSTFEAINKSKDGTIYPVEVSTSFLKIGDKKYLISHVHDISVKKMEEEVLRKSEEKYRLLFENMTSSFSLRKILFDKNGEPIDFIYIEVNPVFEKYAGIKAKDVIGKRGKELHPQMENYWIKFFGEVAKTGKSNTIVRYSQELDKYFEAFAFRITEGYCAAIFNDVTDRVKNEEILKKFKASIDHSLEGVYWINKEGGFDYVNEQACRMLGYDQEELIQLKIDDIEPTVNCAESLGIWNDMHKKKKSQFRTHESFHKKKDGTLFPVEINFVFIWKGNKSLLLANVKDITDQKKHEKEILTAKEKAEESEQRYKVLHDASFGGIFIHDKGIILDCNQGLTNLTGYTREELIGMDGFILVHEKYRESVADKVKKGQQNSYEAIGLKKSGEEYPIKIEGRNIVYKKGEVRCVEFRDISQQKFIEAEILRAKEKAEESEFFLRESQCSGNIGSYKMIFNEGLWITTETLNNIFGVYDSYERSIADWFKVVHPDDRSLMENYFYKEVIEDLKPFNKEYRIIRNSDNEIRWVHGVGKLFFDNAGNLSEILGTIQDITERKLIEEERRMMNIELENRVKERTFQLQQAIKDLEAFSYSVSHDLRAPIRHVDGFMHLLENSLSDKDERVQNYIDKIYLSTHNMSTMIEELLQFSRLGRADLKTMQVNLSTVVEEILIQFKPDYIKRNIQWNIRNLPTVDGDPVLLKIAFENIISNAIKYTSKEKFAIIEIAELECDSDNTCILIKDNGVGFDMTYKEKLFGVFQRLHIDEQFEGVGIGLANVKRIIERHNGKIDAKSEIDKGASFFITLPKHKKKKLS